MADIFISYSSNDRLQAVQLTELLASAGLSVWIDKQGIEAATSWSEEIVDGIDNCKMFMLLLSPSSIESHNVVKELSLASEKRKKILPLDLEPVEIPKNMQYALAGLQRTPMTNIDAIIRAIGKLGLEATQAPSMTLVREIDVRKSLMILPFEDLSPTADNEWFADGIVSELINALTNVKSIRIADNQATKEFKHYHGQLSTYAKAMNIRYFVQGDVRKFGDQIKVSSRLLDIETGEHLWQDSMKGTMSDIFDIQERVAEHVVGGLKIHLTKEEKEKISAYTTNNPEAYELYLKADEYENRHTKADYEHAIGLLTEACRIDPNFALAQSSLASDLVEIYRAYDRNPDYLVRAEETINRMREVTGENAPYAWVMCKICVSRNDLQEALRYAQQSIQFDPDYVAGYTALAFAHGALGDAEGELRARKEEIRLHENSLSARFNLLVTLDQLDRHSELREEAERAIPLFRKRMLLNPDDYGAVVQTACVLLMAGREVEAIGEAQLLSQHDGLDALACVNLASLYIHANRPELAVKEIARALKKGFSGIEVFRKNPAAAILLNDPEIVDLIAKMDTTRQ